MYMELPAADPPVPAHLAPRLLAADAPAACFTGAAAEEEERVYLIEVRYRQFLAVHALQELFESGELNGLIG